MLCDAKKGQIPQNEAAPSLQRLTLQTCNTGSINEMISSILLDGTLWSSYVVLLKPSDNVPGPLQKEP